jgi:hypothetical protein
MKIVKREVVNALAATAIGVAGVAFVPGTAEAHCGHDCGFFQAYTGNGYCEAQFAVPTDCYSMPGIWHDYVDVYEYNMLGTKDDFQGCDYVNYDRACYRYTEDVPQYSQSCTLVHPDFPNCGS